MRLILVLLLAACGGAGAGGRTSPRLTDATGRRSAGGEEALVAPRLGRLPPGVRPLRYALELDVRPARERFSGRVVMQLELARAETILWLHGVGLHVSSVQVADAPRNADVAARWQPVGDDGLVALRLPQAVGPGRVTVTAVFDAAFASRPGGLVRRRVGTDWYAFSRFEASWARHAFPCLDEPGLEALFDLSLIIEPGDTAVAGVPVTAEEPIDDARKRVRFATSASMPTYRLAWAIGPLDVVEAPAFAPASVAAAPVRPGRPLRQGAPAPRAGPPPAVLRGVATRGRGPMLATALEETARGITALEHLLGAPVSLGTVEVVAIPGVNEDELVAGVGAPADAMLRVAAVVLHDVAERWAAAAVSMAWWDELWLREALSGWMAQHLLEALHPELDAGAEDVRRIAWTMGEDALAGARPVRGAIPGAGNVAAAFDPAAWRKGAAALRSLERWIGSEAILTTLRDGTGRHASADAFFAAVATAAGRDVAGPLRSLLDHAGVSVVEVHRQCEGGRASVSLRQTRWLPQGSTLPRTRTGPLPVCVTYGATPAPRHTCTILAETEGEMELEGATCGAWVMPNADAAGYYRWSLPVEDERALLSVAWPQLSARERVAVVTNLAAALSAGTLPAADVLSLLPPLARARERAVVEMPMALLAATSDHLVDDATRPRVRAMGRRLYAPVWARLGWQPPRAARVDPGAATLRGVVGRYLALEVEDPAVRTEAAFRGRAALAGGRLRPGAIVPELADTALGVAAQVGDRAFVEGMFTVLRATEAPADRRLLLGALGQVRDPALVTQVLDLALADDLRAAERPVPFAAQMARREGRALAWAWLQENWDALRGRVGGAWTLTWTGELASFCDATKAAEVDSFLRPRLAPVPGGLLSLDRTVETIRLCAAHAEAQHDSATRFFRGGRAP